MLLRPSHPPSPAVLPGQGDGWSFDSADLRAVNHHPDDDRRVYRAGRDSDKREGERKDGFDSAWLRLRRSQEGSRLPAPETK